MTSVPRLPQSHYLRTTYRKTQKEFKESERGDDSRRKMTDSSKTKKAAFGDTAVCSRKTNKPKRYLSAKSATKKAKTWRPEWSTTAPSDVMRMTEAEAIQSAYWTSARKTKGEGRLGLLWSSRKHALSQHWLKVVETPSNDAVTTVVADPTHQSHVPTVERCSTALQPVAKWTIHDTNRSARGNQLSAFHKRAPTTICYSWRQE